MWICSLNEVRRHDVARAGGKGANLGELAGLGLPVPGGFVVTTEAYTAQTAAWGLAEQLAPLIDRQQWPAVEASAAALFAGGPLLPHLEAAVLAAYRAMGAPPVAVRSSATAEDLADASFAGQQETFLNVTGEAALLQALRSCWASLWGARAVHYRQQRQVSHLQTQMAVVVQQMVAAEAAGVLFTVDPVARRSDRMLLEAAPGLGEAVVSGDVTGDLYRVDRSTATLPVAEREIRQHGAPVLTDDQIHQLARLGLQLEAHFGCPQDVEFAVAGGQVWLLQARPITTLAAAEPEPLPPPTRLDALQRRMLGEGRERYPLAPRPLDNLFWSLMIDAVTDAVESGGFAFPRGSREALKGALWRDVYAAFPAGVRPTWRLLRAGSVFKAALERDWQAWWESGPRQTLEAMSQPFDPAGLTDRELLDRAGQICTTWAAIFRERFRLGPAINADMLLHALVRLAVGRREAPVLAASLMDGLRTRTTEVNEALWELSRAARQDDVTRTALAEGRFDQVSPTFAAKFDAFLAAYGHRETTTWYISEPTWRHNPGAVWRLLQGLAAAEAPPGGTRGRYEEARARVERGLRFVPPLRRYFGWLMERMRLLLQFRENSHFDLTRPLVPLQAIAAEWGRRLTDRGLLDTAADIHYLTYGEIEQWLTGHAPDRADALHQIARRKATYAVVAGRWQAAHFQPAPGAGAVLKGVPASAGTVQARVRVVRSEADWGKLQPGEVLVCPYTNPAWTPLFAVAAAVVTETGGAGAHAAIVAREYGIPAVMGVAGATTRLCDGQLVLVNGDAGLVIPGE